MDDDSAPRPAIIPDPPINRPISDGEYCHSVLQAKTPADRALALRQIILRKFGEIAGMTYTLLKSPDDKHARDQLGVMISAARDAAMDRLIAGPNV